MKVSHAARLRPIHLVMGITSAGKTTFIEREIARGRWAKSLPIIMGYDLAAGRDEDLAGECIVHYNLFRPYKNCLGGNGTEFSSDPVLARLLKERVRLKASVLLARRGTLAKRVLLRTQIEPELDEDEKPYPSEQIFELLCGIDLPIFCQQWFEFLEGHKISYEIIGSENDCYRSIASTTEALNWLRKQAHSKYDAKDIETIIRRFRFEYQAVKLPQFGATPGEDRSKTLALIEDFLPGKSVLDIGCAYGFFCFEAEKRNATYVLGTEVKRHRCIGALILKECLASSCDFQLRDVFEDRLDISFDVVLMLNVLHHLKEPVRALRIASSLAKEVLVVEFPTLSDEKFGATVAGAIDSDCASLPLIGVSLLPEQDQTFLFSEAALKRILTSHDALFSSVEFLQSPVSEHRRLAVCKK